MIARNLTRSSSGLSDVAGFFEHAAIEFEPLQVAIEIVARIV